MKATKGSNDNTTDITLTNSDWSLLRSAKYKIDNNIVEEILNYLPQVSVMVNLVTYSNNYVCSSAMNILWYIDWCPAGRFRQIWKHSS